MSLLSLLNPELATEAERLQNAGTVRIGGLWWWNSNRESYLAAADVILEHGRKAGTLPSLVMPVLYLQRHGLELVLKHVLEMVVDVAKFRQADSPALAQIAKFQVWGHNLGILLRRLRDALEAHAANGHPYPPLPADLDALVNEYEILEGQDHSRLRYDWIGERRSFPEEIVVPAGELQSRLRAVADSLFAEGPDGIAEALYNDLVALDSEHG